MMVRPNEAEPNVKIEYHADDYGMFATQSSRILECRTHGILNGVSVVPNGFCLRKCMENLRAVPGEIAITVHLNLIEGRALCAPEEVCLLTDGEGAFTVSFGSLLLHSFLPGRERYRQQLRSELRAQILAVKNHLPEGAQLRLDGHAHYHMIPVVFDAMMDVIRQENLQVSYIRIPREYPSLYMKAPAVLRDLKPVNLAKVAILNLLAWRNRSKHADLLNKMQKKLFLGVFLSGRMFREDVQRLYPYAIALAQKLGMDVEILAHPGGVYEPEDIARLTNEEDLAFLTEDARRKEAQLFLQGPL